ncbi:MAG: DUF58 domain-containing protein [Desulfosarcinaceae bacterium]|nr:DUF58 domain-containing protein [Desulfosarcinaceae bacterium]
MTATEPSVRLPDVLDPSLLASIANLELRARVAVEGFLAGLHKSPHHGFSTEFSDYRHYFPGDDMRYVDWKVYARSGKLYLKQFEDETNLSCHILLDCSASMGYGSGSVTKLEFARTLAASLAYFISGQRDAVGLITFDQKIRHYLPSRFRRGHLMNILGALSKTTSGQATNILRPVADLAHSLKRKGLVILISDLLDDVDATAGALQQLRAQGSDVIVFHVLDEAELTFPFERIADFVDSETHEVQKSVPQQVRETYLQEIGRFCDFFKEKCRSGGMDYCLLNTAKPMNIALASYLSKRAKSF